MLKAFCIDQQLYQQSICLKVIITSKVAELSSFQTLKTQQKPS